MPAIADIYKVTFVTKAGDQVGLNVKYFVVEDITGTPVSEDGLTSTLDDRMAPLYKALLSEEAIYLGILCQRIAPAPPGLARSSTANQGVGEVTGDLMSRQTAGIISLYADGAGAAFRGRIYVPFPGEASNSATGHPTPEYQVLLTALATEFRSPAALVHGGGKSTTIDWGLLTANGEAVIPFEAFRVRAKWATMKSRGDYGRPNEAPI